MVLVCSGVRLRFHRFLPLSRVILILCFHTKNMAKVSETYLPATGRFTRNQDPLKLLRPSRSVLFEISHLVEPVHVSGGPDDGRDLLLGADGHDGVPQLLCPRRVRHPPGLARPPGISRSLRHTVGARRWTRRHSRDRRGRRTTRRHGKQCKGDATAWVGQHWVRAKQ